MLAYLTALTLLRLTTSSGDLPSIVWQVAPEQTCPTVAQLEAAYARLPATTQSEGVAARQVLASVDSSHEVALVRLSVPQTELSEQRQIDVGSSACQEIAQTIAILAHTWVEHLPAPANAAIASEPAVASAGVVMAPSTPTPSAVVRVEGEPQASSSSVGLTLRLGADVLVSPGASAAPAIALGAELQVARELGIGLLASWIGNLTADDAPYGSIVVQQQLVGVSAAWLIPGVDRWGPRGLSAAVVGALVLWHGDAESYEYPATTSQQLFEPGILGAARLDLQIGGPLFLEAQVSALALARSLSLQVDRAPAAPVTVAQIPWFTLAFGLGLGVKIF